MSLFKRGEEETWHVPGMCEVGFPALQEKEEVNEKMEERKEGRTK